ncbi:MAG: glycosyltransferase family 4 protein, partial [bacterium]|nr:glycosyltransferase family 4 protein [bacterium]
HLNSSKAAGLGALAARLSGTTLIIFTVQCWTLLEELNPLSKFVIRIFSYISVLLSHKTIVLSEHDRRATSFWPAVKNKIVLIPNGIRHLPSFSREQARNMLKQFGIAPEQTIIGVVAELHRNKGIASLIEAFSFLPAHCVLCIIGDGEEKTALETYAQTLNLAPRVHFLGFRQDAAELISGFDMFVLPSLKEGLPFSILDSGAAKVPVVATAVGGIPDIIRNGEEGLLVPPKNAKKLAEAILWLLNHTEEAERFSSALHKKISEKYRFEKITLPLTRALYATA